MFYVHQNPWTKFDPQGLFTLSDASSGAAQLGNSLHSPDNVGFGGFCNEFAANFWDTVHGVLTPQSYADNYHASVNRIAKVSEDKGFWTVMAATVSELDGGNDFAEASSPVDVYGHLQSATDRFMKFDSGLMKATGTLTTGGSAWNSLKALTTKTATLEGVSEINAATNTPPAPPSAPAPASPADLSSASSQDSVVASTVEPAPADASDWTGPTDYSSIPDPKNVNASTRPTPRQVAQMKAANRANNNGLLRDDVTGEPMVDSKKSTKGVTPPGNEAQVDHKTPVSAGGTRTQSNLELRTRDNNRAKSDSTP